MRHPEHERLSEEVSFMVSNFATGLGYHVVQRRFWILSTCQLEIRIQGAHRRCFVPRRGA